MTKKNITYYSKKEERLNVISHFVGLVLSVFATILLALKAISKNDIVYFISYLVFGFSMIILYTASTVYHASREPSLRNKLNIFDHASIFLLIAGTYTPFTLITLKGTVGWWVFGVTWTIAIVGIILKLFFTGRYNKLSTSMYVFMGWIIIFAINPLIKNLSTQGLKWLLAGGVFYTIGAVLYSIPNIKYNHAIFHVFVLIGSFSHFMAVYFWV
jgi:hemolysin III